MSRFINRLIRKSPDNYLVFVFLFFREFCLKPGNLRVFLHLYSCHKFLQARYFSALFGDYLRLKGISVLHLQLQ